MNAMSSAEAFAGMPSREMSSSWSTRNVRPASVAQGSPAPTSVANADEAVPELAVGVQERRAELARDAQELVLVLVADADRDGTGTMPPYRQAQNASTNCSLLATCRMSLSPWRAPRPCR